MKQNRQRTKENQQERKSHPTIGILLHEMTSFHQFQWLGVVDAAQEQGANVICFNGEALRSTRGFDAQGNAIYELIDPARIDGLVLWGAGVGVHVEREVLRDYLKRYHPIPIVCVEQVLEGMPNILMNDYSGTYTAMAHFIEVHGYRRIAFISGAKHHPGAQERYRGYVEALAHYGLPFDPNLVSPPTDGWGTPENLALIAAWLDERLGSFEAVMSVNDDFALGTLTALQARGIRVPQDVALAGFDDNPTRTPLTPPMTTVRPPFYKMARQAAELVLAQLRGETVPDLITLPTELVIRRSCGCLSPAVVQAAAGPVETITLQEDTAETFEKRLAKQRAQLLAELEEAAGSGRAGLSGNWAAQLLDAFIADMNEPAGDRFLSTLDYLLSQVVVATGSAEQWHQVLSVFRRRSLPYLTDLTLIRRAEDLWQQARSLIGETIHWVELYRALQIQQQAEAFRQLGQALITTFDVTNLMDVVARELPRLGLSRCYLALYEDPQTPTGQARLILAYDEDGRIELAPPGQRFSTRALLPDDLWRPDRPFNMVAQPLYFQDQQLGFALFEADLREGWVYNEALRGQLSSALQGALLVEREQQALAEALSAQTHSQKLAAELATVAEVSIATSTILETNQLLQTVVDLTKARFDLYHVHIYLLNDAGNSLNLTAGAGDVGRQMMTEGWRIPFQQERSLVARAARIRQSVIINDVYSDPDFLPNVLLPKTRAEMAVPMIVGNKVVGVLDLQSDVINRFTEDDARTQTILAGQIAVALQNARLYKETQTRVERERLIRAITDKIHRGGGREAILQVTLTELGKTLGASKAVARLGTQNQLLAQENGD